MTPLDVAIAASRAGLSVVPPRQDGTKGPLSEPIPGDCPHPACVAKRAAGIKTGWTHRQHAAATVAELERLFEQQGFTGVGYACGYGGLEMLEVEGQAVKDGLLATIGERMAAAGLSDLWDQVDNGYRVRTPSGGVHWHIRTDAPLGNQKLAFRPPTDDEVGADLVERRAELPEGADLHPNYRTPNVLLAETRGAGGFTIASPTTGKVHPSGRAWTTEAGGVATIPFITTEERDALYDVFRSLDTCPAPIVPEPVKPRARAPWSGDRSEQWMDDTIAHFNRDTSWEQVLAGRFDLVAEKGRERFWRAASTRSRYNATTGGTGNSDTLIIFGTSLAALGWDVYDGVGKATTYDRFSATCIIRRGRNDTATRIEVAKELREAGYGPQDRDGIPRRAKAPSRPARTRDRIERVAEQEPDDAVDNVVPMPQRQGGDDPPKLEDEARYGILGEWLDAVEPHTPAPPAPLLLQALAIAGCYHGANSWYEVGATRHYPRLYAGVVGRTSSGRKGDGLAIAEDLFRRVDPGWCATQMVGGLSSGEGLIARLADPDPMQPLPEGETPEAVDKRLVVREDELSRVLAQGRREGNTLSAILRQAWDKFGDLSNMTKNPMQARGTHVALIGHITPVELAARVSDLDINNGLANRFMWVFSEQAKVMPRPPVLDQVAGAAIGKVADYIRETLGGRGVARVNMSDRAGQYWDDEVYGSLSAGEGAIEALMARSDACMIRVALIYALLDGVKYIDVDHLRAAVSLGKYWKATVVQQWGNAVSEEASRLLGLAKEVRFAGVSVTRHRALLSGHASAETLQRQRDELVRTGQAVVAKVKTKGRPSVTLWAVEHCPEEYLPDAEDEPQEMRGAS